MRNSVSTASGVERTNIQDTIATRTSDSTKPSRGDSTIAADCLQEAGPDDGVEPRPRRAGADEAADQCVRTRGRNAEQPGDDIPDDRAEERGENDARR